MVDLFSFGWFWFDCGLVDLWVVFQAGLCL